MMDPRPLPPAVRKAHAKNASALGVGHDEIDMPPPKHAYTARKQAHAAPKQVHAAEPHAAEADQSSSAGASRSKCQPYDDAISYRLHTSGDRA